MFLVLKSTIVVVEENPRGFLLKASMIKNLLLRVLTGRPRRRRLMGIAFESEGEEAAAPLSGRELGGTER